MYIIGLPEKLFNVFPEHDIKFEGKIEAKSLPFLNSKNCHSTNTKKASIQS